MIHERIIINKNFKKEQGTGKLAPQLKMFAKEAWEPEFDFLEPLKECGGVSFS